MAARHAGAVAVGTGRVGGILLDQIIDLITKNFVEIVCAGVTSVAAGFIVKTYHKLQALFKAEKVNLREKLMRFGEFYVLTKQITTAELDSYEEMYEAYTTLKGNGPAEEMHEKVKEVPVTAVRTIRNPYYIGGEK